MLELRLRAHVPQIQACQRRGRSRRRHPFGAWAKGSAPTCSGRLAELFLKPGFDALLLEARQIVDEDFALEVIDFVLDADREEFLCNQGKGFSVQAKRAHCYA